jgi:hypothetical protein
MNIKTRNTHITNNTKAWTECGEWCSSAYMKEPQLCCVIILKQVTIEQHHCHPETLCCMWGGLGCIQGSTFHWKREK